MAQSSESAARLMEHSQQYRYVVARQYNQVMKKIQEQKNRSACKMSKFTLSQILSIENIMKVCPLKQDRGRHSTRGG